MTDEVRAELTAMQPAGRLGTAEDTAELVRFLLSDQGAWINGQLHVKRHGLPIRRVQLREQTGQNGGDRLVPRPGPEPIAVSHARTVGAVPLAVRL